MSFQNLLVEHRLLVRMSLQLMLPWKMVVPPGGRNLKASWAQVDCGWLCSLLIHAIFSDLSCITMFGMATSPYSRLEYITFHSILSGFLDHIYLNNSFSILSNRAFGSKDRTENWYTSWDCRWAFIIEIFPRTAWSLIDHILIIFSILVTRGLKFSLTIFVYSGQTWIPRAFTPWGDHLILFLLYSANSIPFS